MMANSALKVALDNNHVCMKDIRSLVPARTAFSSNIRYPSAYLWFSFDTLHTLPSAHLAYLIVVRKHTS